MYDVDPPKELLETILGDIHANYNQGSDKKKEKLDAIVVNGDFAMHGLAKQNNINSAWKQLKQIMTSVSISIQEKFPDTPIISTIGNNDVLMHY